REVGHLFFFGAGRTLLLLLGDLANTAGAEQFSRVDAQEQSDDDEENPASANCEAGRGQASPIFDVAAFFAPFPLHGRLLGAFAPCAVAFFKMLRRKRRLVECTRRAVTPSPEAIPSVVAATPPTCSGGPTGSRRKARARRPPAAPRRR